MTRIDSGRARVRAVRLPRVFTDQLDKLAAAVGGYSRAIEALAIEQELPRNWFQRHPGDIRRRRDVRITFRLSARAERALRAWGGRRSLSKIILHLVLYSFTEGLKTQPAAAASSPSAGRRESPATPVAPAAPPRLRPAVEAAPRPPGPRPKSGSIAAAFSHLPPAAVSLPYVCEIPGCEFGGSSGAVVRCRRHVRWVSAAFSHLPAPTPGQRYVCQLSTCPFQHGDGVSTGPTIVPTLCREHSR
jgi:hypothetical protein